MKSEKYQEAESFKKVFKTIFKSDLADLIKSAQESTEKVESSGLQLIQISEPPGYYKCNICDFESKKQNYLKKHIRQLHISDVNTPKMLVCKTCEFKFARPQLLENHIKAQHLNEKHFSCSTCDYKSFYKQCVKKHIISEHTGSKVTKVNKLDCSSCLSNMSKKKIPEAAVYKRKEDSMCPKCSFVTQNQRYLKKHLQLSHGPTNDLSKTTTCNICDFQTTGAQSLRDHTNSRHLNQKRFSCSECDFRCYYGNIIKSHMAKKHTEGEIERISCIECRVNTEHNQCHENKSESEKQNFDCKYCNLKLITSQEVIVSHMKTFHPAEKLFNCINCSFRCNWLYNLKTHKKTEHERAENKDDSLEATFSGIIGLFIKHAETKERYSC